VWRWGEKSSALFGKQKLRIENTICEFEGLLSILAADIHHRGEQVLSTLSTGTINDFLFIERQGERLIRIER